MRKETTVQCRTGESNFMETSESKKEWASPMSLCAQLS